jgi:hypothetical protein
MPLPDRDPTPGELRIMFENIMAALRDVKETMATKEFVNAKFDSHNERMTRLEEDVKIWVIDSTKMVSDLRAEMLERIRTAREENGEYHKILLDRIIAIETVDIENTRSKKSRTVAVTLSIIGAVLSLVVSIVSAVVVNNLIP